MLAGLIQLRSLDVSSNRLTRIVDGALEGLVALDQLNLRDNALTELGPHTFKVNLPYPLLLFFLRNTQQEDFQIGQSQMGGHSFNFKRLPFLYSLPYLISIYTHSR